MSTSRLRQPQSNKREYMPASASEVSWWPIAEMGLRYCRSASASKTDGVAVCDLVVQSRQHLGLVCAPVM